MKKLPPTSGSDVAPKPVRWIGESKRDLSAFPNEVKIRLGGALWDAQVGLKSPAAKHAFQKKSRRGIATPKAELRLVEARLARAKEDYDQWLRNRQSE